MKRVRLTSHQLSRLSGLVRAAEMYGQSRQDFLAVPRELRSNYLVRVVLLHRANYFEALAHANAAKLLKNVPR